MLAGLYGVTFCGLCVMCGFFMVSFCGTLGCVPMMFCCLFVMGSCLLVIFLRHNVRFFLFKNVMVKESQ